MTMKKKRNSIKSNKIKVIDDNYDNDSENIENVSDHDVQLIVNDSLVIESNNNNDISTDNTVNNLADDDSDDDLDDICNKTINNMKFLFEKPNSQSFHLLNNLLNKEIKSIDNEINNNQSSNHINDKLLIKQNNFNKLLKSSDLYNPTTNQSIKKPMETLGKGWYNLQPLELTDKIKRDIKLLELRNYIDPKRFYKNPDKTNRYIHVGTVIEGRNEFKSNRLNKRDRKQSMVDEYLNDETLNKYNKKTFLNIQQVKSNKLKLFTKKKKIVKKRF